VPISVNRLEDYVLVPIQRAQDGSAHLTVFGKRWTSYFPAQNQAPLIFIQNPAVDWKLQGRTDLALT
jgi:hypothetical protein